MNNATISYHPQWGNDKEYYIDENATKLIVGSMPPFRLCNNENGDKKGTKKDTDVDFFYGSKDNYFWRILKYVSEHQINGHVSSEDIENSSVKDVYECKKILKDNNIGILDIVKSCIHNDEHASDNDLLSIKQIDLIKILEENKKINTIFCTSNFVEELLGLYYAKKIEYDKDSNLKTGKIYFEGIDKPYQFYILYSPTKRVFNRFKNDNEIYMRYYSELFEKK